MASIYARGKVWYVRYKSKGKWRAKKTRYRVRDKHETEHAKRLAEKLQERALREPKVVKSPALSQWVPAWIELTWGSSPKTVSRYRYHWRSLSKWLSEIDVDNAALITREICQGYPAWRQESGRGKNTALQELGFLGQILEEAVQRGHIEHNVARKLRIRKETVQHKEAWSDAAILKVGQTLAARYAADANEETTFLYVSFLLGLFQAARLGHCQLPLECVNLEGQLIHYPAEIVKGRKAFSQPIDPRLVSTLREIKVKRTLEGKARLCELPQLPSVVWRKFLDSLGGCEHISHHGLRVTWATRACIAGISLAEAMAFCNHASAIVHRVYQRLSHTDLLPKLSRVALPVFASESVARALPDTTSDSAAA